MNLNGKVVIITGGASGIGLSCCKDLLKNNAKVIIFDMKIGENVTTDILQTYSKNNFMAIKGDVNNEEQLEGAFNTAKEKFGNLDIVINSAGIGNEEIWEEMINVNLCGIIRSMKLAMKYMGGAEDGKGGVVVNIASIAGYSPFPISPVYCATKAGVISLGRTYGTPVYFENSKVRVITICPGFTHTPMADDTLNKLPELFKQEYPNFIAELVKQMPEAVSSAVIQVIKSADNGSVWKIEGGILTHIEFPVF